MLLMLFPMSRYYDKFRLKSLFIHIVQSLFTIHSLIQHGLTSVVIMSNERRKDEVEGERENEIQTKRKNKLTWTHS